MRLEVVKRSDDVDGFHVLPRRWVVERTFGADGRHRAGHQTRYRNIRPAVA